MFSIRRRECLQLICMCSVQRMGCAGLAIRWSREYRIKSNLSCSRSSFVVHTWIVNCHENHILFMYILIVRIIYYKFMQKLCLFLALEHVQTLFKLSLLPHRLLNASLPIRLALTYSQNQNQKLRPYLFWSSSIRIVTCERSQRVISTWDNCCVHPPFADEHTHVRSRRIA